MGMLAKAGTHRQRASRAALALSASAALALACALPAAADEVGTGGGDSFELNLSMEVSDVLDPDAPVHPVTVSVAGPDGEPVAGAEVAYEFVEPNPLYYVPPDGSGEPGEYAPQAGGMALAGEAVTDGSGTARVEGIVRGCDYLVEATAEGYEPYSSTHTCKGTGGEQWPIRLERASGEAAPPAGGGSGSTAGGSGSGAAGAGSDQGFGVSWGGLFPWLSVTGDALLPWLLALSGAALAALALALLARRRKDGADA